MALSAIWFPALGSQCSAADWGVGTGAELSGGEMWALGELGSAAARAGIAGEPHTCFLLV